MKRTSTYKMSKRLKTMLALMPFHDKAEKDRWKSYMINAEVTAASVDRVVIGKSGSND